MFEAFCSNCGSPLQESNKIKVDMYFCLKCGSHCKVLEPKKVKP